MADSKAKGKPSSVNNKSKMPELIKSFVGQLAMGLGVVIPAARTLLYIRALSDLTESQLAHGFEKALQYFKPEFGKTFPLPAEIREWAYEWRPQTIDPSRAILDRGAKPAGWEQLEPGELEQWQQEARERADKIAADIETLSKSDQLGPPTTRGDDSPAEAERRRIAQLEAFWKRNKQAGEV